MFEFYFKKKIGLSRKIFIQSKLFLKKMSFVTLQSSQSLWHRLSVLLNILPKESVIAGHGKTCVVGAHSLLAYKAHLNQSLPILPPPPKKK